jgi:hypothetical protein
MIHLSLMYFFTNIDLVHDMCARRYLWTREKRDDNSAKTALVI